MRTKTISYESHRDLVMLLLAATAVLSLALTPGTVAGQDVTQADLTESTTMAGAEAPITVQIRNNNWLDMRVYAVSQGRRWRLGTAYTGQNVAIEVPRHLQADILALQLFAYPIGGSGSAATGELHVSPGDLVDWELENNLAQSSVFLMRTADALR